MKMSENKDQIIVEQKSYILQLEADNKMLGKFYLRINRIFNI